MLPRTPSTFHTNRRQAIAVCAAGLGTLLSQRLAFTRDTFPYGKDIEGRSVTSLASPTTRCIVAIFVATDCPISNRYLPQLAQLSSEFAPREVYVWLIYPNPGDDLAAVRAHQAAYPVVVGLRQLVTPDARFVRQAHVHVTPEAAIFRGSSPMNQPVLWQGRIDDRYLSFGKQRPAATHHDLALALDATLGGHQPVPPAAPPVGCAIIPRT
jgi:hypothetical protein